MTKAMRTFTARPVDSTRRLLLAKSNVSSQNHSITSLGKALGRGLVGYTSPLPSGPPPTRGMRQWRGAWGRPSPAPPYKLELAPYYQSHPPAPPRKACSWGDDDPAAGALPMSSPPRASETVTRGERAAARSLPGQWGARRVGLDGIGGGGHVRPVASVAWEGGPLPHRVRSPTSRTTPARAVRRHNGPRTGPLRR